MMIHHYPLQAHIYLVALHRFLQWRLPNYSPQEHLGGYVYIFLRGVPSKEEIDAHSIEHTIPGLIVEEAPLERIERLDQLLKRGGK